MQRHPVALIDERWQGQDGPSHLPALPGFCLFLPECHTEFSFYFQMGGRRQRKTACMWGWGVLMEVLILVFLVRTHGQPVWIFP